MSLNITIWIHRVALGHSIQYKEMKEDSFPDISAKDINGQAIKKKNRREVAHSILFSPIHTHFLAFFFGNQNATTFVPLFITCCQCLCLRRKSHSAYACVRVFPNMCMHACMYWFMHMNLKISTYPTPVPSHTRHTTQMQLCNIPNTAPPTPHHSLVAGVISEYNEYVVFHRSVCVCVRERGRKREQERERGKQRDTEILPVYS